ncbi:MAG: hypothetical protein IPL36_03795 [Nigerium sp.]|nr:hypothetical protein [Nigerium sp.]
MSRWLWPWLALTVHGAGRAADHPLVAQPGLLLSLALVCGLVAWRAGTQHAGDASLAGHSAVDW